MSRSDDESSDIAISPGLEGEPSDLCSGPGVERVRPGSGVPLGWGTIGDDGGAPSILEVADAPEGSMRARAPTLHFYDIKRFEHKE